MSDQEFGRWEGLKDCQFDLMQKHGYTEEYALDQCIKIYERVSRSPVTVTKTRFDSGISNTPGLFKELQCVSGSCLTKSHRRSKTSEAINQMLKPYTSKEKPVKMPKWKPPSQATILESDRIRRKWKQEREAAKHGPPTHGDRIDKTLAEYYAKMRQKAEKMGIYVHELEAGQVPQAYPKIKGEDDFLDPVARVIATDNSYGEDGKLDYSPVKPGEKRKRGKTGLFKE